eukprot:TRINITY_DN1772_c0_g2_i1.p1 TRINITY_DN1772_c0_g2~~TRINITY_DN1772_c0_g2_i1.p1  ORF type:complete len:789 (-),score=113.70 TRINITY_DN1772_c0_g2_i1:39-2405(-)
MADGGQQRSPTRRLGRGPGFWMLYVYLAATSGGVGSLASSPKAKTKPLFEYDDHYVMLNDYERNEFYRRGLERVVPSCGPHCSVLDLGAGSGLLSMMAAHAGAANVVAIEANPALAELAARTVERNKLANFPKSNVTVVAKLSSGVDVESMPSARGADILVTETFGTMLLGEGAANFVPDARDRLMKSGGTVIPAGGCQYVTLVEVPEFAHTLMPRVWGGLNLSRFEALQDSVYWKATVGASRMELKRLTERLCVLEVDLYNDTRDSIPENRTFRVRASQSGTVHAALLDWDVWLDSSRSDLMSTAPGTRRFAGDVAWGWLLQTQEDGIGEDWVRSSSSRPTRMAIKKGELIDIGVEFVARGISAHVRSRRAPDAEEAPSTASLPGLTGILPTASAGSPARMRGVNRPAVVEVNEVYLPLLGDLERHRFYESAVDAALSHHGGMNVTRKPTLLDCSGASVSALLAAKKHGMQVLALTRWKDLSSALRDSAEDNGIRDLVDAYAANPRDLVSSLLPRGEKVDIVVIEPPGTPVHGLSPFAILPAVRKYLLKDGGSVVPAGACFQVGLVQSRDAATLFSVPGGRWSEIDLSVWNEESVLQGVLGRLVPYTKWFGPRSTTELRWLSKPKCVFEVDLSTYGLSSHPVEDVVSNIEALDIVESGNASVLAAEWVVWGSPENKSDLLDAKSEYLGRSLTWPLFVQAVAAAPPSGVAVNGLPPLEPVGVTAGEAQSLEVTVRQGTGKVTGAAGPEFVFRLLGTAIDATTTTTTTTSLTAIEEAVLSGIGGTSLEL